MMRVLKIALIFVLAFCSLRGYASGEIKIKTKDLVYSAATQQLYVSVPSEDVYHPNTVTAISPKTYRIGFSFLVPGNPGKLALSDDGRYLYVALEGPSTIARLDLIAQTMTPVFSIGAGVHVEDMAVLPGHPESVAIARRGGIAVYDNGTLRPNTKGLGDKIVFAGSPTVLYSCNSHGSALYKNTLDATGVIRAEALPIEIPLTYELKVEADRLYTAILAQPPKMYN